MKFPSPYSKLGDILNAWKTLTDKLKQTAEERKKFEGAYKHYQQTLEKIFFKIQQLSNGEHKGVFSTLDLFSDLKKELNSFTEIKGKGGCPLVITKSDYFEKAFAGYFVQFLPRVITELESAYKKDTAIPGALKWMTDRVLKQGIKAAQEDVRSVEISLNP
ncbi:MAG: hypothetical protein JSR33_12985 [Proteobacteria bacterium]|nr:hypothetical protein [Pseudomonadota bacterium]